MEGNLALQMQLMQWREQTVAAQEGYARAARLEVEQGMRLLRKLSGESLKGKGKGRGER